MEEMICGRGFEVGRPGNDSEPQFLDDDRYDNSGNGQAPPRTEDPLVRAPVAQGGGDGGTVPTAAAGGLNADPLYASLRRQLAQTMPDAKVAEVAPKIAQGGGAIRAKCKAQPWPASGSSSPARRRAIWSPWIWRRRRSPRRAHARAPWRPDRAPQPEVQQSQGGRSASRETPLAAARVGPADRCVPCGRRKGFVRYLAETRVLVSVSPHHGR